MTGWGLCLSAGIQAPARRPESVATTLQGRKQKEDRCNVQLPSLRSFGHPI